MLRGAGHLTDHLVCPVHRWTYNTEGQLIGAPHFDQTPCLNLERQPLQNWNGLLFAGPRSAQNDLAGMRVAKYFDATGYRLDHVEMHECNYNWKTFIEVYLEDYHVEPFHPGLGSFVTCDDLEWQFADWYLVQKVGITRLQRLGSEAFRRWSKTLLDYNSHQGEGARPAQGALWLLYFPNVMVEWYPQVLVVSTLFPQGVDKTMNVVEFYYPEEVINFERDLVEAQQAAYMETAVEDDNITERMDCGRFALCREGRDELGPYQSPMEDGMKHFHEFYRRIMGSALAE